MKIGVVSDIHSNIDGLRTALALIGPVDRLLCLGDCIFEHRFSNEVVALLRERDVLTIRGNHEQNFLSPQGERARTRPWVDQSLVAWIADLPRERDIVLAGKRIRLVHATPWEPGEDYIHPGDPRLEQFGEVDADYVLYGHTHAQLAQRIGRVMVVNPGSAGDGRDPRNGRLLSCAVIDLVSDEVTLIDFPDPQFANP